ncbi:MAG: TAXI family TRAP transporter solute-binding subunit [Geminicoccaceae bacterium]|nr:TAXI family TRAP transporter solute-binding subunit [Geminicoccaceae bacterium]
MPIDFSSVARRTFLSVATAAAGSVFASRAPAQTPGVFRIGTGGIAGTYYPIGGLLADIISAPIGGRSCDAGGSCGVDGLIGVAVTSQGSIANIEGIVAGTLDSGLVQSDIAFGAFAGEGVFADQPPIDSLRLIASLYLESVHLVASVESGIVQIGDIAGKRVSIDDPRSGTQYDARLILGAFGLGADSGLFEPALLNPLDAVRAMRRGELDAFFAVAGHPTPSVAELAREHVVTLVPIEGPEIDKLVAAYPFFTRTVIPADAYTGIAETPTLGVVAQWLTDAGQDEELIYSITRALWHPSSRTLLDAGHTKGREIQLDTALDGVAVPLHPGAERYYAEAGLLP